MTASVASVKLNVDLLARELGYWRTSSTSGPAYRALADGLRMLIIDGRVPVGARLPSERALAEALRVSRTTVTTAYTQMRDEGYLKGRQGARSTTALPITETASAEPGAVKLDLAKAAMAAPASTVLDAFSHAAQDVAPYLNDTGLELIGLLPLRRAIARRYCARGLPTQPDEIMVTTGCLSAVSLILATYVQAGDRVLIEQPTYPGIISALAAKPARAVPMSLHADAAGDHSHRWDADVLDATIRQTNPTLAYLTPDNHNPTGITMAPADRERVAHIVAKTRTRTVIDETMAEVWLDEPMPAPFAASATSRPDLVISIGSMSKSFWGGLRIGWIRAERSTLAAITAQRPSMDIGTPIVEQLASARLLAVADDVLPARRAELAKRRDLLLTLLAEHLPDWRPIAGTGGMSCWVELPVPMSSALSASASRMGLDIPAGPRFGVEGTLERYIRVPYTLPEAQLTQAVALLARAWRTVTGSGGAELGAVVT